MRTDLGACRCNQRYLRVTQEVMTGHIFNSNCDSKIKLTRRGLKATVWHWILSPGGALSLDRDTWRADPEEGRTGHVCKVGSSRRPEAAFSESGLPQQFFSKGCGVSRLHYLVPHLCERSGVSTAELNLPPLVVSQLGSQGFSLRAQGLQSCFPHLSGFLAAPPPSQASP